MIISTPSYELAAYSKGNRDAEKIALVLPGFLDTKDHPHMRRHVDFLSMQGFYALSFDPPGTWGSAGDISIYTMTNWLESIDELITHFGTRPTFVMGHSRGGSMAMLAAIRNPHVFAFASVMSKGSYARDAATVHPVQEWEKSGFKVFNVTIPGSPGRKQEFRVPYSTVQDTRHYRMLDGLQTLTKPKLFVAGRQDTVVTPEVVRAAFDAASGPKELYMVDSDHLYRRRPEIIDEINQRIGMFLTDSIV